MPQQRGQVKRMHARMSTVQFIKVHPDLHAPMRADPSALGTMPAAAHQYCEALRVASAFGWYVFMPQDLRLRWNGSDVFIEEGGAWQPLSHQGLPWLEDHWDAHCPSHLRGMCPPYLTLTPARGVVQIWSGLLVSTARDWNVLVRPLSNAPKSHLYDCFEGVVQTDIYGPWPLFMNIQLLATDTVIELFRDRPLYQIQPLHRSTFDALAHQSDTLTLGEGQGLSDQQWQGYRQTVRTDAPDDPHRTGQYASMTRKRDKSQGQKP